MSIKRKGITKGEMVQALKHHEQSIQYLTNHILLIDDVVAKYIKMNKHEDKLADFMNPEEKNGEPKQKKRKRSRRNATTGK